MTIASLNPELGGRIFIRQSIDQIMGGRSIPSFRAEKQRLQGRASAKRILGKVDRRASSHEMILSEFPSGITPPRHG